MMLRNVPFLHWDEWIKVKNNLYSNTSIDDKRMALETVSIWRKRGNVPFSVDLTAQIVDVQLQDSKYSLSPSNISSHQSVSQDNLLLLYSMVVVRSVNSIVEPSQQSYFAQSILSIAERLGLPGWIVELRHDATHKQLPSLSVLRAAGEFLLEWYYSQYWEPQYLLLQTLTESCLPVKYSLAASEEKQVSPEVYKEMNEIWLKSLLKNATSSSFLVDIFLPFFTSAVTKGALDSFPAELQSEEQVTRFEKVTKGQISTWKVAIYSLLPIRENWLHSCLCRFLLLFIEIMESYLNQSQAAREGFSSCGSFSATSSSAVHLSIQVRLTLFWCKYLIELSFLDGDAIDDLVIQVASDKKKKKKRSFQKSNSSSSLSGMNDAPDTSSESFAVLSQRRKQFATALKIRLMSLINTSRTELNCFKEEVINMINLVDFYLTTEPSLNTEDDNTKLELFQKIEGIFKKPFVKNFENVGSVVENQSSQNKKRSADSCGMEVETISKSQKTQNGSSALSLESFETQKNEIPLISCMEYLQIDNTSSTSNIQKKIYQCSDMPLWPLGLLPGRYDCNELLEVEEIKEENTS
jgi:hypothetical protein